MKIELTSPHTSDGTTFQTGWVIEVAPETGALLIAQGHREVPEVVSNQLREAASQDVSQLWPHLQDRSRKIEETARAALERRGNEGCMPVAQPAAPPPQANLGDEVAEPEPPPAPTPRSPFFGKK